MIRAPLNSSNIVGAGYDAASATMEVEFTNGNIYQYFDIPQQLYDGLMQAESAGKYLNENIKGVYRYARV